MNLRRRILRTSQRGASLLLSILLMVALSLLALAAASDSVLQQRVTVNLDHSQRATNSANSALAWAEDWLLAQAGTVRPNPCSENCSRGDIIRSLNNYSLAPEHQSEDWWNSHAYTDGLDPANGMSLESRSHNPGQAGQWIIEEAWHQAAPGDGSGGPAVSYYRIIARGGGTGGYAAVTESILARPWGEQTWADDFPAGLEAEPFCRSQAIEGPCGRLAWRQRR